MTTAVAMRPEEALSLQLRDGEKLALLRETLTSDLNPNEFDLFVEVCRSTGLNPFMRQIHAVKRGGKNPKMTIQVGIDGFRLLAERTGGYAGQDGPYWCGADGEWKDVWLSQEPPRAAKVGVIKRGFETPIYGIALYDEFVQTTTDYNTRKTAPNSMWAKMPAVMLAKCAEAQAFRKAFPAEMSGIYTDEEMGQADNQQRAQTLPVAVAEATEWAEDNNEDVQPEWPWMEEYEAARAAAGGMKHSVIAGFLHADVRDLWPAIDSYLIGARTTAARLVSLAADWKAAGGKGRGPQPEPAAGVEEAEWREAPPAVAEQPEIDWDNLSSDHAGAAGFQERKPVGLG